MVRFYGRVTLHSSVCLNYRLLSVYINRGDARLLDMPDLVGCDVAMAVSGRHETGWLTLKILTTLCKLDA